MRVLILTLFAALAALAQKVTVEFDQAADFKRYKTFAIRDGQLNSRNPALNSELVKKRIDADIERYLTARGLTMVLGPSDLNVALPAWVGAQSGIGELSRRVAWVGHARRPGPVH